jgi:hypothetical protein
MSFRNHYNMHRIERARVVEGENLRRFEEFLDKSTATQNFITVKVICHSGESTPWSAVTCDRCGLRRIDTAHHTRQVVAGESVDRSARPEGVLSKMGSSRFNCEIETPIRSLKKTIVRLANLLDHAFAPKNERFPLQDTHAHRWHRP